MISKRIAEIRKERDWSQTDLASKSGVSREMIGKYERGEAVPSIEAAKKIADAWMLVKCLLTTWLAKEPIQLLIRLPLNACKTFKNFPSKKSLMFMLCSMRSCSSRTFKKISWSNKKNALALLSLFDTDFQVLLQGNSIV